MHRKVSAWALGVLLSGGLACDKDSTASAAPSSASPTPAEGSDSPEPEPTVAPSPEAPPTEPAAGAEPEAPPTEPAEPAAAAESEPVAQAAPSARAPLPKPLHGKVVASCGNDGGVGEKLKAFKLETPDGKAVGHRSYGDRVLLVNFWGTWCKPCLEELPEFDRLYRRYRKHGLTLIAIATDEDPKAVQDFVDRRKLAAKVLIGGEAYAGQYESPKFPFTFVVDPQGTIVSSYRGFREECMGKLEADLRAQLEARGQ